MSDYLTMKYRREIDGLRALAILPVILLHADFASFSGGFVGVDIFFVISGYLISNNILEDMKKGSFSLLNFYEKRARRILPALFFVVLFSIPLAWFWMMPQAFQSFSQSVVAVPIFASNILFWLTSGYFDTESALKPLLHTWSLAVEEQFYVLFPLLLMLIWKYGKKCIITVLSILFIASITAAHWNSTTHSAFTFYMLPTRGFEILTGALISIYFKEKTNLYTQKKSVNQLLSLAGLALILLSIFIFDNTTPFPSLFTLIPTIGTGFILLFANSETLVGKALGSKLLVGIGLISYSAYLWHQPLLALLKYKLHDKLNIEFRIFLICCIFLLSILTWKYIEKPFRSKEKINKKTLILFSIFGSLIIISIGLYGYLKNNSEITLESFKNKQHKAPINSEKIMLLGDSHAEHLAFGLQNIYGDKIVLRTYSGCIPFYNVDRYDSRNKPGDCVKKINFGIKEFETDESYKLIILASMGPVYLDGTAFKNKDLARVTGLGVESIDNKFETNRWIIYENGMRNTLKRISSLKNKKIIFVLDVPELGIDDKDCGIQVNSISILKHNLGFGKNISYEQCKQTRSDFNTRVERYHSLVKNILKEFPNVVLFDPTSLFCDDNWCYGTKEGNKLYRDVDHLSKFGSEYIAKFLSKEISKNIK